MSRPHRIPVSDLSLDRPERPPQGLRPEIQRIIEALAKDMVAREDEEAAANAAAKREPV
jgi:hypothetical protein